MTLLVVMRTYPKLAVHVGDFKRGDRIGWFRILGWGLHIKDTRRHDLLFSERNGHTRALVLGPYRIRLLAGWKRS